MQLPSFAKAGGTRNSIAGSSKNTVKNDSSPLGRDFMLYLWGDDKPGLVFGTWKAPRPVMTRNVITWCKEGQGPGVGDCTVPWGFATEEIYVIGTWSKPENFKRRTNFYNIAGLTAGSKNRPDHPTPKPVQLMKELLLGCMPDWVIADPFAGSGATLLAAADLGRQCIGVELEEKYCEITAQRLDNFFDQPRLI